MNPTELLRKIVEPNYDRSPADYTVFVLNDEQGSFGLRMSEVTDVIVDHEKKFVIIHTKDSSSGS